MPTADDKILAEGLEARQIAAPIVGSYLASRVVKITRRMATEDQQKMFEGTGLRVGDNIVFSFEENEPPDNHQFGDEPMPSAGSR